MRIAVFGTGGVGGYFGGKLAQAGNEVIFIARGDHLRVIRSDGLRVDSILGDFIVASAQATDEPAEVGPVDLVLLGLKAWQVRDVAASIRPLLGKSTCVLPLQNGVEAADILADELGANNILGGLCGIISFVAGPGHIRHVAENEPFITLGERDNQPSGRSSDIFNTLDAAGIKTRIAPDIQSALWQKLLLIDALSSIGAITRSPVGVWRSVPETLDLYEHVAEEAFAVAQACGIAVPEAHLATVIGWPHRLEPAATTSLQRDLAEGRPSELEEQIGVIVRRGQESGMVPTLHSVIYNSLLPGERQAREQLPIGG